MLSDNNLFYDFRISKDDGDIKYILIQNELHVFNLC